jgi:electron transfer flavoprotein beta subunit
MNIVVCVKYVPDATADRHFESDHTVDRVGVPGLLSELDEYAVEQALQIKEKADGEDVEVTALTVGPEDAADAIKKALQMGADKGVHVVDDAIAGSDSLATSQVLAAAIEKIGDADLVVCGMASTDASMSVVPAMLAERLDLPQVTLGSVIERQGKEIRIKRDGDTSTEVIGATAPLVLSVTEEACGDLVAQRHRGRRRRGRAGRRLDRGGGHRGAPAAHPGRDRHRRGRLGREGAGRVPRVQEVHLSPI